MSEKYFFKILHKSLIHGKSGLTFYMLIKNNVDAIFKITIFLNESIPQNY